MNNDDSEMDSLYSEDKPEAKPKSVDEQEQANPTHLLDKKAFPAGCEVGQTYTIKVVAEHGDEAEIEVVKPEQNETGAKPEGEPESDPELAEMDKNY